MSKLQLSAERKAAVKDLNVGRIIIFCEGKTEKYYLDYFASIIRKNNNKYNDVEVILQTVGGNAQTVLNFGDNFMAEEQNNKKYSNYEKFLIFDCDSPKNIQPVIMKAKKYDLLVSNFLFEVWLLMHFEDVKTKLSKREIYKHLSSHLHRNYKKGSKGITREIIQNGNIEKAIDNAKALAEKYDNEGNDIYNNITLMNPYSNVYKLVERFLAEITNIK